MKGPPRLYQGCGEASDVCIYKINFVSAVKKAERSFLNTGGIQKTTSEPNL
jgi:hypothetical protein